jgi:hypothetical protein
MIVKVIDWNRSKYFWDISWGEVTNLKIQPFLSFKLLKIQEHVSQMLSNVFG